MAQFLRDEQMRNYSINLHRIDELFGLFEQYRDKLRVLGIPDDQLFLFCVIRFDGKGNRVYTLDELKRTYRQADRVERILFTLETAESRHTNRLSGYFMDVKLDRFDQNGFLIVSADDQTWVDGAFSSVSEALGKGRAWYRYVRNTWVELLIQMTGAALVFLLSLSVAKTLTPHVKADNPLLFAFIFVFLLCANVWSYLQRAIHVGLWQVFPNVQFVKEGREYLHWIIQGCVTSVMGFAITYAVTGVGEFFAGTVGALVK